MTQENPVNLSAIIRGEPCRREMYWRCSDQEGWR